MKKLLLILPFLLPASLWASAANVYVSASGAGSMNGTSCANALPVSFAQSGGNWGSGSSQIGPGSTLHLCGTFTLAAGGQLLDVPIAGTAGNPITVLMETGAVIQAPYFSVFGALADSGGHDYITFDGGTNGTIKCTDNGSGLTYQQHTNALFIDGLGSGAGHVIVQNATFTTLYQHTSSADVSAPDAGGIILQNGVHDSLVTQNTTSDTTIAIVMSSVGNNVTASFNSISRTVWGINVGNGPNSNLQITNNDITCVVAAPCNWVDNNNNSHMDGIVVDPQTTDVIDGLVVANNFIHDMSPATAYIFLCGQDCHVANPPNITNMLEYNNVFFTTAGQAGPANAMVGVNKLAANNTLSGPGAFGFGPLRKLDADPTLTMKNNIVQNTPGGAVLASYPSMPFAGIISDFNDWFNVTSGNGFCPELNEAFNCGNFAFWKSQTSQDSNSITTDPNLTAAFLLNMGSPAIGTGVNLTSLGIAGLNQGAPETFGRGSGCGGGCVPRSATNPWDMGAYPFGSGGGGSPAVCLSPTGLTFGNVTQLVTSSPLNVTLTNCGTATLTISSIVSGNGVFAVTSSPSCNSGCTVAASGTITISTTFTPAAVTSYSSNVAITSNASTSVDHITPITGTGVALQPPPAPAVGMFACFQVPAGTAAIPTPATLPVCPPPAAPQGLQGPSGTIALGTVTTGAPGTAASVSDTGTPSAGVLHFTIPRGNAGAAGVNGVSPTVTIGPTTTGAPGSAAAVTNTGTPSSPVLAFTIPQGAPGAAGSATPSVKFAQLNGTAVPSFGYCPDCVVTETRGCASGGKGTYYLHTGYGLFCF